jgi:RNA polymerase sigma factor for flagellar operon FliA
MNAADSGGDRVESTEPVSGTVRVAQVAPSESADVAKYMPLVRQEAARCLRRLPPNVLKDDLIAAGTFGLIDALRKQGAERGPTFEGYARIRIRGAIFDELRSQDWLSRRARNRAEPGASTTTLSDLPPGASPRGMTATAPPSALDLIEKDSARQALAKAVESLPERERQIVDLHYFQGVQFKAIAVQLGVSEPRISQLHSRATKILRGWLAELEGPKTPDVSEDIEPTEVPFSACRPKRTTRAA